MAGARTLMNGGLSPFQAQCPVSQPPTCVTGTSLVPFLLLEVWKGSGASKKSGQDTGKGALELLENPSPDY